MAGALSVIGLGFAGQMLRRSRARRRRFNPYIAGAPVLDDDMFYGREKLTARMLSTLHRNSLMITGERRIGKTTFLHHLKRVLADDDGGEWRFFPVFVDLQGVPEQGFFHALIAETVDSLELKPATREQLRFGPDVKGYDARDFSHDLQRVIDELKTRTPRKVKLALLIDEVDVLNEYSESVNQRLRGIFMKTFSENLVAVMSGVGIKRRWKSEVSPWYNFFDEVELKAFSRDEAEALVREPVEGIFRWRNEAVERVLELSQHRPYLVQKLCVHALNRMLEQGRSSVRLEDVDAARDAALTDGGHAARVRAVRPRAAGYGRLGVHDPGRRTAPQSLHRRQLGQGRELLRPRRARARGARGRAPLALGARRPAARQDQPAEGGRAARAAEPRHAVRPALLGPAGQRRRARAGGDAARAASRTGSPSGARPTCWSRTWRACRSRRCSRAWCAARSAAAGGCCCSWTRPRSCWWWAAPTPRCWPSSGASSRAAARCAP